MEHIENTIADMYDSCLQLNNKLFNLIKTIDVIKNGLLHDDDHNNSSDICCMNVIKDYLKDVYCHDVTKICQLAETMQKSEKSDKN